MDHPLYREFYESAVRVIEHQETQGYWVSNDDLQDFLFIRTLVFIETKQNVNQAGLLALDQAIRDAIKRNRS